MIETLTKEIEREIDKYIVGKGIIKCCTKKGTYYFDIESRKTYEPEEVLKMMEVD